MTDISVLSQRQRQFEKEANDRFHDHGKHIARIEGIMEERTRSLREDNVEIRRELKDMSGKIEKVEERLAGKIEGLGATVGNLSQSVVRQGVYIGLGAALGAALMSVALQQFASAIG